MKKLKEPSALAKLNVNEGEKHTLGKPSSTLLEICLRLIYYLLTIIQVVLE
jgi:ubiquitin